MNMTFTNKTELCDCINQALKAVPNITMESLIGNAKSLVSATRLINLAFEAISEKNHGTATQTNINLIAQGYRNDDCGGCNLPQKHCRCTVRYNCERVEGSMRGWH